MSESRKIELDQILNELRLLEKAVLDVKNSDSLPFSFFKESFNRTQEITRLLHKLEFMQVDEMKDQIKRLVSFLSETGKKEQQRGLDSEVLTGATLSGISESGSEVAVVEAVEAEKEGGDRRVEVSATEDRLVAEVGRRVGDRAEDIVEEVGKVVTSVDAAEEIKQVESDLSVKAPGNKYAEGIDLPEYKDPRFVGRLPKSDDAVDHTPKKVIEDLSPQLTLNDKIHTPPALVDLKRGISLNDRFLFQRELFNNDREEMDETMKRLNRFGSYDEAERFLMENSSWDFENPTVVDFLSDIKKGFQK